MIKRLAGWILNREEQRKERLSAYIDGELSPRKQARLEMDLEQDPSLRADLEELHQLVQMIRSLPRISLPRSFTLDPAAYSHVVPRRFQLYPAMRIATIAATLMFIALTAGGFLADNLPQMASAPAEVVVMEPQAFNAVETAAMPEARVDEYVDKAVPLEEAAPPPDSEKALTEMVVTVEVEKDVEVEMEGVAVEREMIVEQVEEEPLAEAPASEEYEKAIPSTPTFSYAAEEEESALPPLGHRADAVGESDGIASPFPTPAPSLTTIPSALPTQTPAPAIAEAHSPSPTWSEMEAPFVLPTPSGEAVAAIQPTQVRSSGDGWEAETDHATDEPMAETGPSRRPVDGWILARIGAGALALGLLIATILARRFDW